MADERKKRPFFYGSAGMEASGMMPAAKKSDKEEKESTGEIDPDQLRLPGPVPEPEPEEPDPSDPSDPSDEKENEDPVTAKETANGTDSEADKEPRGKETPGNDEAADEKDEEDESAPLFTPPEHKGAVLRDLHTKAGPAEIPSFFGDNPEIETLSVSDPDPESRGRASALNAYAHHEELLATETPEFVAVETARVAARTGLVRAALETGAHVVCASPLAGTLKEADEIDALLCEKKSKLAVAHPLFLDPAIATFLTQWPALLGELLEIRVHGGHGEDSGGTDLLKRGMPLLAVARAIAGDISWCSAHITTKGERSMEEDRFYLDDPGLGPLLGDRIQAHFHSESAADIHFVSDRRYLDAAWPESIEVVGTRARARIATQVQPRIAIREHAFPEEEDSEEWTLYPPEPLEPKTPGQDDPESAKEDAIEASSPARSLVADWLRAIEEDREPACSIEHERKALEMVHAIWQAGLSGRRAYFPLINRLHPLADESL